MPDSFDDWVKNINPHRYPGARPERQPTRVEHIPVPGEGYATVRAQPLPDFAHDPGLIHIPGEPPEKSLRRPEQGIPGEGLPTSAEEERDIEQEWANFMRELKVGRTDTLPVNRTNPQPRAGYESPIKWTGVEASAASAPDRVTKQDVGKVRSFLKRREFDTKNPKARQEAVRLQDELYQVEVDAQNKAMSHQEAVERLNSDYYQLEGLFMGDPSFDDEFNAPTSLDLPWGQEFI